MPAPSLAIIQSDVPAWQRMLSDLVTDPQELLELLGLDHDDNPFSSAAATQFPFKLPRWFLSRIKPGDWNDPILRQLWPASQEEAEVAGYGFDPLQESQFNPVSGLLHKYSSRVLLTASPHCAVHCRYCFRRHFDYAANAPSREHWRAVFDYIANEPRVGEVILSGGDPLALPNRQLDWLIEQIEAIPHVNTLRIHTRMTTVLPQRIDEALCARLKTTRLSVVLVSHCNHAQELSPESKSAFQQLRNSGVTLLNQSVILTNVNDNVEILADLSRKLFEQGVLPYYLHLPDAVAGTAHFDVELPLAQSLVAELQTRLPGYLVPRLVREEAGEYSKTRYA